MSTLRDLTAQRHELDDLIDVLEGELPPELEALWDSTNEAINAKVERWGLWVLNAEHNEDAITAEIKRLTARRNAIASARERSKAELQRRMEAAGLDTVKGTLVTVKVATNNPSVAGDVTAEALLAMYETEGWSRFVRHIPESFALDKTAVLAAGKAGEPIPEGLAITRSRSLRIK